MREYDRKQKTRLSRAIANGKSMNVQMKKSMDNRDSFSDTNNLIKDIIQFKSITDDTMELEATRIAEGNTRSTLSIAKIGENDYVLYAQRTSPKIRDSKSEYDNLSKVEWIHGDWPGLHAEMFAVSNEPAITKIAASQPICKRCLAALASYKIDAINPGTQYTENWLAPTDKDSDEDSDFPSKASDPSRNGESGWRYGMHTKEFYLIEQSKWKPKHPQW